MKPIKPHFYIREEAILIFSLSAVSTAIRGLRGGSGMEALGGSAHSGDKLTARAYCSPAESSAGMHFSLSHTHTYAGAHARTKFTAFHHTHTHICTYSLCSFGLTE